MFAVLEFTEPEKKILNIFYKNKFTSQRITLPSGEAFFRVNVFCRKNRIPWKKLERCLGILKQDVLLPDDIKIPDGIDITAFKPDILPRLLLMNSATDHIQRNNSSPYGSLTVFDEKAIYQNCIERLIDCFSTVRVVTPEITEYETVCRKLLQNYGFSLVVTSEINCDSDVVISHSCSVPLYFGGKIYTCEKKYLMNAEVFTGRDIIMPPEYELLLPQNINKLLFASALYEKCNVTEMGSLLYSNFL